MNSCEENVEKSAANSFRIAIVFICDVGFIIPTVGAAVSARKHTSDPDVQVLVFLLNAPPELLDRLHDIVALHGISVASIRMQELAKIQESRFPTTLHIPIAALARLWIEDYLDPEIEKFLYLDGDIDITGSLDPLLSLPVPAGGFLAAPDLPLVIVGEKGGQARAMDSYLHGLGNVKAEEYFNSGVLLVDRSGWRNLGQAAGQFFIDNTDRCRWHDQSALNAVAGRARGRLSLRWNYSTAFMRVLDPRNIGYEPTIWHFTGFPKPWDGDAPSWTAEFGQSFTIGMHVLKPLEINRICPPEAVVAAARRESKRAIWRTKWLFFWRPYTRARRVCAAIKAYPM